MLSIGSLFSGIGGLELGLEMAVLGPVLFQVEIDPFCREVLAKHWPNVPRYNDVREVSGLAENDNPLLVPDVLCGGFPCTGISDAGKRTGLEDEGSALWFEYTRLVRELRPRFVVIENGARLLTRGLDRVVDDLERAGYGVTAREIHASDVGAPHGRERIFVVAHTRSYRRAERWAPHDDHGRHASRNVAHRRHARVGFPPGPLGWGDATTAPQPCVHGSAHGISDRVDRVASLGNAVVPWCAELVGEWVLALNEAPGG